MTRFLERETTPIELEDVMTVGELVRRMRGISFQGRNVAIAEEVWGRMLEANAVVIFGLAGALVPAGMRKLVALLIERRMIDCLVSTGANLFHDAHEIRGLCHYIGDPGLDDVELLKHKVDRIYDTLASEEEFRETDRYLGDFAAKLDPDRSYTTREFLSLLGKDLSELGCEDGILTAAYRTGTPIYCPAIGDSGIGIGVAAATDAGKAKITFDVIEDVIETARIATKAEINGGPGTGVVYVGGGTPKNFIQQSKVSVKIRGQETQGHRFAVQITADAPHWGGLSGCTFKEAQSWGKVGTEANMVTVNADATIALPFIVAALLENRKEIIADRMANPHDMASLWKPGQITW